VNLTRIIRATLAAAALACCVATAVFGQQDAGRAIGLDTYRLVRGPIEIAGLSDNASGLAYSPVSKTLFLAVDRPTQIVELDLDGRLRRRIDMRGFEDTEGIAHWKENWFAVVEERRYMLCFVAIGPETRAIDYEPAPKFQLETDTGDNSGLEGVAIDPAGKRFYCLKEKLPRKVYVFPVPASRDARIRPEHPWSVDDEQRGGLDDLSGAHFDRRSGHLLILSHESAAVLECTTEGKTVARLSLRRDSAGLDRAIPKAEGITMDAEGRLYICSEPNLLYVFSK